MTSGVTPKHPGPPSPRESEIRRRDREERAAATAVLETIIRRMAVSIERRNKSSSRYLRHATHLSSDSNRRPKRTVSNRRFSFSSTRVLEVKKEEWDEAIAEALF